MSSFDFARALVKHGANVNAKATARRAPAIGAGLNMVGATPFLMAARTKDAEYMRLLVELGADPLLPNNDKTTPLMVAAGIGMSVAEDGETESDLLDAVRAALELGNDINAVDDNGETAMHGAAYKHLPAVVRYLSQRGAKVGVWNQKNKRGWTPLTIAEGVHRGMNIISSPVTAVAIREVLPPTVPPPSPR